MVVEVIPTLALLVKELQQLNCKFNLLIRKGTRSVAEPVQMVLLGYEISQLMSCCLIVMIGLVNEARATNSKKNFHNFNNCPSSLKEVLCPK